MAMILYGSLPSPYVRRIRMLLEGVDYQFKCVDLYEDDSRQQYSAITPIKKLPVLIDRETSIFDSHVIQQYLSKKFGLTELSIEQSNIITAIDAVCDSLIVLFMAKRSGFTLDAEKLLFKLQLERIPDSLVWLNQKAQQGAFADWHFASIALISLVDWARFRDLYEFSAYPDLLAATRLYEDKVIVKQTVPQ